MCSEELPMPPDGGEPSNDNEALPNIASFAVVFEAGLAVVACGIGWLVGVFPFATIAASGDSWTQIIWAVIWGVVATVPLVLGLFLAETYPTRSLRRLNHLVESLVARLFGQTSIVMIAVISLAAGIGEEALFRGFLQAGLSDRIGPPNGAWIALVVASILFGVCHWLSNTYAALATIMGIYLGGLFIATDNLIAPITTHALYDLVALVYFLKRRPTLSRASTNESGGSTSIEPPLD